MMSMMGWILASMEKISLNWIVLLRLKEDKNFDAIAFQGKKI
jgi:hypothetical protein